MRYLLRMQVGKYVLFPESPEQNPPFSVAQCHVGFSSPSSAQSFLLDGIYGRFYCSCHVCVWTVKCNRNSISWHSRSLVMTSAGKCQKVSRSGFICSGLTLLPIKIAKVGLWCQWDSIKPFLRCLWSLYLSLHHSHAAATGRRSGVVQGNASPPNTIEGREMGVLSVLIEMGHWSEIPGGPAGMDCPWAGVIFVVLHMGRIQ